MIGNRCFANDGPGIELATLGTDAVVVARNVAGGNTGTDYNIPASPNVAPTESASANPGAWVNIEVQ